MSVLTPPPQDELELLIREARERQRKRRLIGASVVAVAAAAALGIYGGVSSGSSTNTERGNGNAVFLGGLPRCKSNQLSVAVPNMWGAAAGNLYEPVTLTNTSRMTCALAGWPAVRRFDRAGQAIPVRLGRWVYKQRGPAPYAVVKLAPGRAATFEIAGSDWNHRIDRACRTAQTISVEPRGGGGWLSLTSFSPEGDHGIPACRWWSLGPFVPGRVADPPFVAFSMFYTPPTRTNHYFAGQMNGTKWQLHVRDGGDGRYCFSVVTDAATRGGRCGRLFRPGPSGKLGFIASSRGTSFVAGAVVSAATHVAVSLSNGRVIYPRTMPPNRFLAPGISFFFTTIPHGARPLSMRARKDSGRLVVEWPR